VPLLPIFKTGAIRASIIAQSQPPAIQFMEGVIRMAQTGRKKKNANTGDSFSSNGGYSSTCDVLDYDDDLIVPDEAFEKGSKWIKMGKLHVLFKTWAIRTGTAKGNMSLVSFSQKLKQLTKMEQRFLHGYQLCDLSKFYFKDNESKK
jgi:hypothetical protein